MLQLSAWRAIIGSIAATWRSHCLVSLGTTVDKELDAEKGVHALLVEG